MTSSRRAVSVALLAALSACGASDPASPSATPSPGQSVTEVESIRAAAASVDRLAGAAVQATLLRSDPTYAAAVSRHFYVR